jgi:predicted GNAT family acetyltransferase
VQLLIDYLARLPWGGLGFTGPVEAGEALAAAWTARSGTPMRVKTALRLFESREVIPPAPAPGEMIPAAAEHLDVLTAWREDFFRFISEHDPDSREGARRMIDGGTAYLWRDRGELRSIAAVAGPTPNGIRVNHVYTPPEFRGRGYASNLVAAVTRRMLDGGRTFCTLFTDLSNPTSNKIYQRIGYRPVCDCAHWVCADGEES